MKKFIFAICIVLFVFDHSCFAKVASVKYQCPQKVYASPSDAYGFIGDKNIVEIPFTSSQVAYSSAAGGQTFSCYYGPNAGASYNFYTVEALSVNKANCPGGVLFDITNLPSGMQKSNYTGNANMRLHKKVAVKKTFSSKKKKIKVKCLYGGPSYPYYGAIIHTIKGHNNCNHNRSRPRVATCR